MLRRSLSLGGLAGILLLCACGGVPKTRYYTVAMPAPAPASDARTSFVLDVPRFRAADILRDDRILYYKTPTEVNRYEYHRWSATPAEMMAELAARRLRAMGAFQQVRLFPRSIPGDYILQGRLMDFEELDYEPGGRVRVSLQLELLRTRDRKVVWSETRRSERGIQGKGVAAVAEALNASAAQVLDEALPGLTAEIEREAKPNPAPSQ
jgi:cholesterol transport system auxiliary component